MQAVVLPLIPVVGAYSSDSIDTCMVFGRSGAPGIGPASGAPCPMLAHSLAVDIEKPFALARSEQYMTPVEPGWITPGTVSSSCNGC
jgi:hypothetical protein